MENKNTIDNTKLVRFLLTLLLGWIGSIIINHTSLKPEGYTSRSWAYFILLILHSVSILSLLPSATFSLIPLKKRISVTKKTNFAFNPPSPCCFDSGGFFFFLAKNNVKKYERFLCGRLYFLAFLGKIYKSFMFSNCYV